MMGSPQRKRNWTVILSSALGLMLVGTSASSAFSFNPLSYFTHNPPKTQLSVLTNPIARLYDFYSKTALLPVLHPSGESPGDVYADLLGGRYLARSWECFSALKPVTTTSNIPTMKDAKTFDLTGEFHAAVNDAKLVNGSAGLKFTDTGQIAFDKVTAATASALELQSAIKKRKSACDDVASLLAGKAPRQSAMGSIILGSVWSGAVTANWEVQSDISGKIGVNATELEKLVNAFAKKIRMKGLLNVDIGGQVALKNGIAREVTIVSKSALPVAWLPIAISRPDLDDILKSLKDGHIEALEKMYNYERKITPAISNSEIKRRISKELNFPMEKPQQIAAKASRPPYIPFNVENPDHLAYIRTVDTLLAVSYELNSSPPAK